MSESEDIKNESFAVHLPNGCVTLDPYARKTREELKRRCRELCRALDEWQTIAMIISERGRDGLEYEQRANLDRLIEAYRD